MVKPIKTSLSLNIYPINDPDPPCPPLSQHQEIAMCQVRRPIQESSCVKKNYLVAKFHRPPKKFIPYPVPNLKERLSDG